MSRTHSREIHCMLCTEVASSPGPISQFFNVDKIGEPGDEASTDVHCRISIMHTVV